MAESPVYVWSVTGSLLFGSPLGRVWGLQQLPLPPHDLTWVVLDGFWLSDKEDRTPDSWPRDWFALIVLKRTLYKL